MKTFQHADYTLIWTEQVIADDVAPDTDTAISTEQATYITVAFDTYDADTGAPDFDLHAEVDIDGTNYTDSHWMTLFSAQAKDVRDYFLLTPPRRSMKLRLDVNTANLVATETVTAYVYMYY